MRPYNLEDLPLVPWAHPLCGWDATPDLALATWKWPLKPRVEAKIMIPHHMLRMLEEMRGYRCPPVTFSGWEGERYA